MLHHNKISDANFVTLLNKTDLLYFNTPVGHHFSATKVMNENNLDLAFSIQNVIFV
jgi:hypothetical protein